MMTQDTKENINVIVFILAVFAVGSYLGWAIRNCSAVKPTISYSVDYRTSESGTHWTYQRRFDDEDDAIAVYRIWLADKDKHDVTLDRNEYYSETTKVK